MYLRLRLILKFSQQNKNEPGYSDVILAWQQAKPYRLHVGIDDSGSDATGKYQGTATLSLDHVLTLNDLFYISYNHDLGGGNSGKHGTDGFMQVIPFHLIIGCFQPVIVVLTICKQSLEVVKLINIAVKANSLMQTYLELFIEMHTVKLL